MNTPYIIPFSPGGKPDEGQSCLMAARIPHYASLYNCIYYGNPQKVLKSSCIIKSSGPDGIQRLPNSLLEKTGTSGYIVNPRFRP